MLFKAHLKIQIYFEIIFYRLQISSVAALKRDTLQAFPNVKHLDVSHSLHHSSAFLLEICILDSDMLLTRV